MHIDKYMKFDDEVKTFKEMHWGRISKFIFKNDHETLRLFLRRMNKQIYNKVKAYAK